MIKLTKTELAVLKLVEKGFSNKEIAEYLNITIHTSKAHVSSIIKKLGAKNRTCVGHIARTKFLGTNKTAQIL